MNIINQLRKALESIQLIDTVYDDCQLVVSGELLDTLNEMEDMKLDIERFLIRRLNEEEQFLIDKDIM